MFLNGKQQLTFLGICHMASSVSLFISNDFNSFNSGKNSHEIGSEMLHTQTDNGWTIYESRTLTHNLCSCQSKKPNHNVCNNWPRLARIWWMTAKCPVFSFYFQLRTKWKKANTSPKPTAKHAPTLVSHTPSTFPAHTLQSEHTWLSSY